MPARVEIRRGWSERGRSSTAGCWPERRRKMVRSGGGEDVGRRE
jgi:hypothetical protein